MSLHFNINNILEGMKQAESACGQDNLKFYIALSDYLSHLYTEPCSDIDIDKFIPPEKKSRIDRVMTNMQKGINESKACAGISGAYIQAHDRPENFPSLLIRLLEYFCAVHRKITNQDSEYCLSFFKKHGCYDSYYTPARISKSFAYFEWLCRTYNDNNYQYQQDDEIKEYLLESLSETNANESVNKQFEEEMERLVIREAKNYKSFFEILSELAETREEFGGRKDKNGNPDLSKLYEQAGLSENCYKNHKTKNFMGIKREAVIALILTLKLNIIEAEALMKSAGFQFNDSIIERFVKIMIITKNWSNSVYKMLIKRYYNLFYTHANHNSPLDILKTVAKKYYQTQYARTSYIKELFNLQDIDKEIESLKDLRDSTNRQVDSFEEICRLYENTLIIKTLLDSFNRLNENNQDQKGKIGKEAFNLLKQLYEELNVAQQNSSDEAFQLILLKKMLCLENTKTVRGETVKEHILHLVRNDDVRKELDEELKIKINDYMFNEHKQGAIAKSDIAVLKKILSGSICLDLTDILDKDALDKLKRETDKSTKKQALYHFICENICSGAENDGYKTIFDLVCRTSSGKITCGQSTVDNLLSNKIKLPVDLPTEYLKFLQKDDIITDGLINSLQGNISSRTEAKIINWQQVYHEALLRTLCSDKRQNFKENYRYDMTAFISHLKAVNQSELAEIIINIFNLKEYLFGDGCKSFIAKLQKMATTNIDKRFSDKKAIDFFYERVFGDNYQQILQRHESYNFDLMTKAEEKDFNSDLNLIQQKFGKDILIINYI